jgi:carbamoyltransferase
MKILGISEGFHDAGACLIEDGEILSATHAERYSRKKNDRWLHQSQMVDADVVAFYEKPWLKRTRQLFAGQGWKKSRSEYDVSFYHHQSHAAAGFYTSPFDECNILVIDSIGEWDTVSIWKGWVEKGPLGRQVPKMKKIKSMKYPFSYGLFYSAITQRIGLKPNEDEYITMGMAAYGEPIHVSDLRQYMYSNCHKGIGPVLPNAKNEDIAASAQNMIENEVLNLVRSYCKHDNLVFMGGVALNCVANSRVARLGKNMWIMPNPGDCGSSLGAAALAYGKKLNWKGPYLGTNIKQEINPKDVVEHLLSYSYCGIANGRSEFGPRALGNRSLIADPRRDIKDTVNQIKRRQLFRPFAPAILEEYANEYFEGPMNEYMQFVANAKHDYSSVTHVDGTARVQVVRKDCQSILRTILEEWYEQTQCPILLNTSLNIKGQPMVDTWSDAEDFTKEYNVKVF